MAFEEFNNEDFYSNDNRVSKKLISTPPNQIYPDFYETITEVVSRDPLDSKEFDQASDLFMDSVEDLILSQMDKTEIFHSYFGRVLLLEGFLSANDCQYRVVLSYFGSDLTFEFTRLSESNHSCETWSVFCEAEGIVEQADHFYDPSEETTFGADVSEIEEIDEGAYSDTMVLEEGICLDIIGPTEEVDIRPYPLRNVELMFEALNSDSMVWGNNQQIIDEYFKSIGLEDKFDPGVMYFKETN